MMLTLIGSTKIKRSILFTVFFLQNESFADIKSSLETNLSASSHDMNSTFKIRSSVSDKIQVGAIVLPIQTSSEKRHSIFPEYFISLKDDRFGKITAGSHISSSDALLVDGGSLVKSDSFGDTNNSHYFTHRSIMKSSSYDFKISYLSRPIKDRIYIGLSHTPSKNISQARLMYADSLTDSLDLKYSIGFTNSDINSGVNLQYLGVMIGASVGLDYQTLGIGYGIGPFKTAISYLNSSDTNGAILKLQYKLNKNILPTFELSREKDKSGKKSDGIAIGIRLMI